MVDSSPSEGGSASNQDPKTQTDGDHDDDHDDRWVKAINELAARSDPVPEAVREAARRAHRARGKKRGDG